MTLFLYRSALARKGKRPLTIQWCIIRSTVKHLLWFNLPYNTILLVDYSISLCRDYHKRNFAWKAIRLWIEYSFIDKIIFELEVLSIVYYYIWHRIFSFLVLRHVFFFVFCFFLAKQMNVRVQHLINFFSLIYSMSSKRWITILFSIIFNVKNVCIAWYWKPWSSNKQTNNKPRGYVMKIQCCTISVKCETAETKWQI